MQKKFIQNCVDKHLPYFEEIIDASAEENKEYGVELCRRGNECFIGPPCTGDTCRVLITDCTEKGRAEGTFHTHPTEGSPDKYLHPSNLDLFAGIASNYSFAMIGNIAGIISFKFKKHTPEYREIKGSVDELVKKIDRLNEEVDKFNEASHQEISSERALKNWKMDMKSQKACLAKMKEALLRRIAEIKEDLIEPIKWWE